MDLHSVCEVGDLNKLKYICDKFKANTKSNEFLYKSDPSGVFPLDLTVINDRLDCCKYLIENFNLNPFKLNENGESSISHSLQLSRGHFVKYFIDNYKKFLPMKTIEDVLTTVPCNKSNVCAFQCVIESAHPDCEKTLMLLMGYLKVNFSLRKSLFIGAVKICNTLLIETVLNFGKINEEERRELINLHFNPNLNYMKKSIISQATMTPLIYAISKQDRQLINFLINDQDIDVDIPNIQNDKSSLQLAIELIDIETVMLLLEKRVNRGKCLKGVLPLESALKLRAQYLSNNEPKKAKENLIIIELLASVSNDVYALNESGQCPFDYAVKLKLTDVIEHFYYLKCDLYSQKNKAKKSPIDYADVEYGKFLREKFPPN